MVTAAITDPPPKTDGRRELGERTRQRLLDAARELLAERGEDAIRLRDITDAAQVNVAAVHYHFGSLKALYTAAITEAFDTVINEAIEQLSELGDDATLDEIASAWARPVIAAFSGPCGSHRRAFMRIMARAGGEPTQALCEWKAAAIARYHDQLVAHLRRALPEVSEDELRFRVACAAGILHVLRSTDPPAELQDQTPAELERRLVPVLSGALQTRS